MSVAKVFEQHTKKPHESNRCISIRKTLLKDDALFGDSYYTESTWTNGNGQG